MVYRVKEYHRPEILRDHLKVGGSNKKDERIEVNSLYFSRAGKPWIPVMGEYHFARNQKSEWKKELCKIKAGGVTVVATYLFWIYHEEEEGVFDFEGNNDIRAFVLACQDVGLDVILRIGPWAHGECRNGGFPDWLQKKGLQLRTNDPEYLRLVRIWYSKIAEQVEGLFYKEGGNIIGIQLENEFCTDADHLAMLKKIAIECGFVVPLYTVTGWNSAVGAKIPVDEVVPVFGGYCDAPWAHSLEQLPPSPHYFFNPMRNDTAIGCDLIEQHKKDSWQLPYERYPFATCELGGGMQATHHRRPLVKGMDIYAVSLVKLAVGNNLVGYYMYHGGTHRIGKFSTLQESKSTGYPNDYPILSYDFQSPLSEYGEVRQQYRLLNLLHLFLQNFQERFACMTYQAAEQDIDPEDVSSLRYGIRRDEMGGYVFINHYQRLAKLQDHKNVVIDTGEVEFPPIDVCGEVSFFMPFHMEMGKQILKYATAQPVCKVGNTYFFVEIPGIKAQYCFEGGNTHQPESGMDSIFEEEDVQIVTLPFSTAMYLRCLDGEIYIGKNCDLYKENGIICAVEEGSFTYSHWNGKRFETVVVEKEYKAPVMETEIVACPPFSSPYMEELQIEGERAVIWKKLKVTGTTGFIEISDPCDVSQIYADGMLVADNYYYGKPWRVPASLLNGKECYLGLSEMKNDFYREF